MLNWDEEESSASAAEKCQWQVWYWYYQISEWRRRRRRTRYFNVVLTKLYKIIFFHPTKTFDFLKKFIFLFFERIQFSESELDRTIILFISLSIAASKRSVHKRFNFFAIIRIDAWVLRLTTKWTFKRWICLLRSAIISGVNLFFGTIFSLNCFSWKTRIFTRFFHSTSILYCKSKIKEIIFLSFITSWTTTRKWGGPVPASPRRFNWKILNLFFRSRHRD